MIDDHRVISENVLLFFKFNQGVCEYRLLDIIIIIYVWIMLIIDKNMEIKRNKYARINLS